MADVKTLFCDDCDEPVGNAHYHLLEKHDGAVFRISRRTIAPNPSPTLPDLPEDNTRTPAPTPHDVPDNSNKFLAPDSPAPTPNALPEINSSKFLAPDSPAPTPNPVPEGTSSKVLAPDSPPPTPHPVPEDSSSKFFAPASVYEEGESSHVNEVQHEVRDQHEDQNARLGVRPIVVIDGIPGVFVLGTRGRYQNLEAGYLLAPILAADPDQTDDEEDDPDYDPFEDEYDSDDDFYDPVENFSDDEENEPLPVLAVPDHQFWCRICFPVNGIFFEFDSLEDFDLHRDWLHRDPVTNTCLVNGCGTTWANPTKLALHQRVHHFRFIPAAANN